MEKLKSIADLMDEIASKKNGPINSLPKEHEALINHMDENGKLAATKLIVNAKSKDVARKTFLGTFDGITCESIMQKINTRVGAR